MKDLLTKSCLAVWGITAVVGIVLAGCSSTSAHSDAPPPPPPNMSPKDGNVVDLGHDHDGSGSVWKWCDGTTLLYESKHYYSGGIAAIQNSPECR